MTYYRIAIQNRQNSVWIWKTTPLTSLRAVVQHLRSYSALPQERIRVFIACSKEQLDEMLSRENASQVSGSSTAAQFLLARKLHVSGITQSTSEQALPAREVIAQPARQEVAVSAVQSLRASYSIAAGSFKEGPASLLERRRFEIEYGQGGDHDTPYRFTLPPTTPQMLAWIRLRARVQEGKLEP